MRAARSGGSLHKTVRRRRRSLVDHAHAGDRGPRRSVTPPGVTKRGVALFQQERDDPGTQQHQECEYHGQHDEHLPAAGEIVLFDRSWYNRAGVERVMGFCNEEEYQEFLRATPLFEEMLLRSNIKLIKYWFSVSDEEQERRFQDRLSDPSKHWKLSPMDLEARRRWVDYSRAKDVMFARTDTRLSPWWVVEADNKRRARLNTISHLLSSIPYEYEPKPPLELPKRQEGSSYVRPPRETMRYVPEVY